MSLNRVIGAGNKIPWHLPEDFKWFKQMTLGHILVMGRRTFDSIGRPLPQRTTLVLSRGTPAIAGVRMISSLAELPPVLKEMPGREVFVCGGAQVYEQALPLCSDLYLTLVKRQVDGDAFFPPFEAQFELNRQVLDHAEFKVLHYKNLRGCNR